MNYASFTRVTWIDKQIQMGKLISVNQIAQEFNVSQRTAERDLQKMRDDLGAVVTYNRTRGAYEYSGDPITLPAQWLNKEEIALILIAEKSLRNYTQTSFNTQIHPAFNQFLNPIRQHEEEMSYVRDMCNAVHFYQPFTPTVQSGNEFALVLSAILESKKLKLHYNRPAAGAQWRTISPFLLLNNSGIWQIIGYEKSARKIKTYALEKCSQMHVLNEYFAKPHDFKATDYYTHPFEFLKEAPFETITLCIKKPFSDQIISTTWHPSQTIEPLKDEGVKVHFVCHRTAYFKQWCRGVQAVEC